MLIAAVGLFGLALATAPASESQSGSGALVPTRLRCEYFVNPLGIDVAKPKLSWNADWSRPSDASAEAQRGQVQTAYRIQVASTLARTSGGKPDLWDSGRVASPESLQVRYSGKPLSTAQTCYWRVQIWDRNGRPSPWSKPQSWTIGILKPADWKAKWIALEDGSAAGGSKGIGFHAAETRDKAEVKWVQIDLGRQVEIDSVEIWPVRNHGGFEVFGLPKELEVAASNDAEFKTKVTVRIQNPRVLPDRPLRVPSEGTLARYVRVSGWDHFARNDGVFCFAIAEVKVFVGGENVADGTPVTSKDTVEHSGWTRPALTDGDGGGRTVTSLLRKRFTIQKQVRRATAFVCGLGQYELTINGGKVGNAWITPGWTQYGKKALYDTYDVTSQVRKGAVAVGIELGNGMYHMASDTRGSQQLRSFGLPKAIGQILVEHTDGTRQWLVTDKTWRASPGAATYSGVFGGEDYDARREPLGWQGARYDDSKWRAAREVSGPGGRLAGLTEAAPPIVVHKAVAAVDKWNPKPGLLVLDLGQNSTYIPKIVVQGPRGAKVRLWPAEILKTDRTVDQTTTRPGKQVTYILRGDGKPETYVTKFWYTGCRYWQVEAFDPLGERVNPAEVLKGFHGLLAYSASEPVGTFECSDELFNKTHSLILWAIRSNLASVISDCPHREKSGWLEQIHLNGPALMYSFDMMPLFRKTVEDMADAQQPDGMVPTMAPEYFIYEKGFRDSVEWGGAYVYLPGMISRWYGDRAFIGKHFAGMKRYVDYLTTKAKDGILSNGLGDWNGYGNDPRTPVAVTDTAYYYLAAETLASFARSLDKQPEAEKYGLLAESIKAAFVRQFVDEKTGKVATGSQSCQATALDLGLVPNPLIRAAFDRLVEDVAAQNYAISCGEVGHPSLLRSLSRFGRADLIYRIHHQSERPGYGWQIARGATALTEAWDASPISHDHFMLGHIMEWFYSGLAGLSPGGEAWSHARIAPEPVEGVDWAKASYRSIRGMYRVEWRKSAGLRTSDFGLRNGDPAKGGPRMATPALEPSELSESSGHSEIRNPKSAIKRLEAESFVLEVEVPPGCGATVELPKGMDSGVTVEGKTPEKTPGVEVERRVDGTTFFRVGSGRYCFESRTGG